MKIKEASLPILNSHMALFFILPETKDKLLFNELALRYGISKSSLSDIVSKYKTLNILDVVVCESDKRTIYVGLTDKALEIKQQLMAFEASFLDMMLKGFDQHQRDQFLLQVKKIKDNLSSES